MYTAGWEQSNSNSKSVTSIGNQTRTVQSVASHYTDDAIQTLQLHNLCLCP